MLAISVMHVSQWMRAHLRINACHVPMATVFPEDVYRACTFRSFCKSKNCGAGTLKHGAFEFERGRPKREGGRSATVRRFGENPAFLSLFPPEKSQLRLNRRRWISSVPFTFTARDCSRCICIDYSLHVGNKYTTVCALHAAQWLCSTKAKGWGGSYTYVMIQVQVQCTLMQLLSSSPHKTQQS